VNTNLRELTESALAVLVVGGVVGVAVYDGIAGHPVSIPPELYGFGGIVIGAYFRGAASVNGVATKLITALKESSPPPAGAPPAA
jgi:hypothetical protein